MEIGHKSIMEIIDKALPSYEPVTMASNKLLLLQVSKECWLHFPT